MYELGKNKNNRKLLLVEDDLAIAMGLEYSLQQENYQVTICNSVASAMASIASETYDLALLDISLPDGNGFDICKKLKELGDTPVIFLTARDDEGSVVMGLDIGADDYITKPFRIRELQSRIRSVLRRSAKQVSGDIIQYGNVTVNITDGKVMKNGQDIFLTALEYRLLLTLINNEGRVVSRNQLLEGIWDVDGDFVNDNTLTVYIKRLREKIEDDPQKPVIIKTIRGFGYQIN
ncbi:MAG: response regulator transcription factor [Clostridiales bacterium]|nr:response regulator transcription factor [Clostridiales bacterium]